jgi:hypothetical protein
VSGGRSQWLVKDYIKMRILYIIGNGLDIAHHLNTSYQDFFNYYLSLLTTDGDIIDMKNDIKGQRYETWADLEMGLGAYSSKCANKEVFLKCLLDIKENLTEYLKKESQKIGLYEISSIDAFLNPSLFFEPEPQTRYDSFCNRKSAGKKIDIITFNYTTTLELLLGFKNNTPLQLTSMSVLNSIQHIHGTLTDMMVMGVNDSSQIANTTFNTDMDIVEDFIKPEYNDACLNNKNRICESIIQNAEIIVLYGTSLGFSDDKWWKFIGKRMEYDDYPLLTYLPFDEKKDPQTAPNRLRRWTMEYVREVRNKFGITLDEKGLAERMCIALNKRLFPIKKVAQQPITR